MDAHDPVAVLFHQRDGGAQEAVVAPAGDRPQGLPVAQGGSGIEDRGRARPGDAAGRYHDRRPPAPQKLQGGGEVEQVDRGVSTGPQGRPRETAQGDHAEGPARPAQRLGDEFRQPAGPGDQDQGPLGVRIGLGHGPAAQAALMGVGISRGVQIERLPPRRMKSRISRTAAWDSKVAATSSTRSISVPSGAKSRR